MEAKGKVEKVLARLRYKIYVKKWLKIKKCHKTIKTFGWVGLMLRQNYYLFSAFTWAAASDADISSADSKT